MSKKPLDEYKKSLADLYSAIDRFIKAGIDSGLSANLLIKTFTKIFLDVANKTTDWESMLK